MNAFNRMKQMIPRVATSAVLCLLCFAYSSPARAAQPQPEPPLRLDWFSLDGGGGAGSGGPFTLVGSIGQPDAGDQRGGAYRLVGGFWGFVLLSHEPQPAPDLRITRAGSDLAISWPSAAAGFQLEEAASLTSPISWNAVPTTPVPVNGHYTVTVAAGPGVRFYRLRKP